MPDWEGRGVHEHPGVETLSAYLDGALDNRERESVETHLAACEACLELVTEVIHVLPDAQDGSMTAVEPLLPSAREASRVLLFPRRRWGWVAAAAVAAAVLLAVVVQRSQPPGIDEDPMIVSLVAAVGTDRPIEARLTPDFAYGPYRGEVRSGAAVDSVPVSAAAAALQQRAARDDNASHRHAWGVAQLVVGDTDAAITTFESALTLRPGDVAILSDLSAAYLTRSRRTGQMDAARTALGLANEALQRQASFAPALFNRALALEGLRDQQEALRAWQALLAVEGRSPWAEEARQHVTRLTSTPPV